MPQIELTCTICGDTYLRWPSQVKNSRFCSQACLQEWRKEHVTPHHKAPWLRDYNLRRSSMTEIEKIEIKKAKEEAKQIAPRGKNGKLKYKQRKGEKEHRLIAAQIVGRNLTELEIVHHIDENPANNDPSNLAIAITKSEHRAIHNKLRAGIRPMSMNVNLFRKKKDDAGKIMNYKFKTRPFRHQVKALKKVVTNNGGALFMEMGTGKTKVAIDWVGAMHMRKGIKHVVVVCPKSVLSVWPLEIHKHMPPHLRKQIKWTIINYDKLPDREVKGKIYEGARHRLIEEGFDAIIVDESHKIKNPNAKRTKALMAMSKHCSYRLILTGTPVTNNPLDLFSQFKFLDETRLGTSYAQFKKRYAVFGGYGNHQLLRYINLDELSRKVKPITFEIKKHEAIDLPSRMHQIVHVYLDKQTKDIYDELAKEAIAEFEDVILPAQTVLTRLLRMSQLTSGHFKSEDGYKRTGTAKASKAFQLLDEMKEQEVKKVVIFCRFLEEMKDAAYVAKKAGYNVLLFYGKTSESGRHARLENFKRTSKPTVFIAQISTGSMGIDLTASSRAIFWSHSYDNGEMLQCYDRIHRIGQHVPVNYYHLLARGTVDEAVWLSLQTKKRVADLVLRRPHLLMQEGMDLKVNIEE